MAPKRKLQPKTSFERQDERFRAGPSATTPTHIPRPSDPDPEIQLPVPPLLLLYKPLKIKTPFTTILPDALLAPLSESGQKFWDRSVYPTFPWAPSAADFFGLEYHHRGPDNQKMFNICTVPGGGVLVEKNFATAHLDTAHLTTSMVQEPRMLTPRLVESLERSVAAIHKSGLSRTKIYFRGTARVRFFLYSAVSKGFLICAFQALIVDLNRELSRNDTRVWLGRDTARLYSKSEDNGSCLYCLDDNSYTWTLPTLKGLQEMDTLAPLHKDGS